MSDIETKEIKLTGVSGSPGICIGKAYLVDKEGVKVIEKYFISKKELSSEIKRFKSAAKKAKDELRKIIEDSSDKLGDHINILKTHLVLHEDKMLYGKAIDTIKKDHVNAEWALKKVVSEAKVMFQSISDPYIKGRATDIEHVYDRIMKSLIGRKEEDIGNIDKRVILVAHNLSPADTSQIQLERIMGFVTDRGGKTSHTAIIARTLDIPSVLGLDNATGIIKTDDIIIVDGIEGVIIIHPEDETILHYEDLKARYEEHQAVITRESHAPAETKDGIRLNIMGNIELPEEIVSVRDYGGDGIGLYRTEFLYLSRSNFPREDELFEQYKEVVELMSPSPVTIRTLDINGDKEVAYASENDEANPALGLRAIRFCLKRQEVFKTQLRAILRASAFGNVRIMFPMISGVEEVLEAKKILSDVSQALDKEGILYKKDIEIGIMIEVPSAVVMADALADVSDFFSIGTNDLVQYLLAIDRGNKQVAYLYHPLHPAVIRMIKFLVDVAKSKGIKVFMCGEMAGDPYNMPLLLGLGLDELSMNPQSIPAVKKIVKSIKVKESIKFVDEVIAESSTAKIHEMMQNKYGELFSKIKSGI
ncbi:MAG: phosphoenolpyruvate--protein phosphotransferase [Desulfobacteraceae bacterium]|nr:phosphoenolpyruvate--protein phosphotransferase [Desulfobacteraceae bacterium]